MKFAGSFVFLSVVLGTALVSSSPIRARQSDVNNATATPDNPSVGAVFFITNEPNGNFVVSASIGADGQLTLRQAASAIGNGAHGITDPAGGPDPLFSQGCIKASSDGIVATVNAGSNTVTAFSADKNDPAVIRRLGSPVSSGGEFPVSLAFNKQGNGLCVLNGGQVNGVQCFNVDKANGLSTKPDTFRSLKLNQTTPATGPAGSPSHIIYSEDGTKLIVSVKGVPPKPGFLAVWNIDEDGNPSEEFETIQPSEGGLLPFSLTNIPGKNAVLATDAGIGFDLFDLSGNGERGSANEIKGQGATCWSSFSPKTKNFYLTDIITSLVTEVNVDDNLNGTVVKQYSLGEGAGVLDNDIASIGDNDFMYILSANQTAVDVMSLNAPGDAKNIQRLDLAEPAKAVGITINGDNLQGMAVFLKKQA